MSKLELDPEIRVATFFDQRLPHGTFPRLRHVSAYTLWYNPEWPGCIIYNVVAPNGKEARKLARRLRLNHEREIRRCTP